MCVPRRIIIVNLKLEGLFTINTVEMRSSTGSKNPPETVRWRLACPTRNGTSYSHFLTLNAGDTGSIAMEKLRSEYYCIKSSDPYTIWDRDGIFFSPVLYIAITSEVPLISFPFASQFNDPNCVNNG